MATRDDFVVGGVDSGSGSGGVGGNRSVTVGQEVVSWTPKTEGQGSWDRRKAVAGSDAPVWRVDLKRGVYTADVKITQVGSLACWKTGKQQQQHFCRNRRVRCGKLYQVPGI